MNIQKEELWTIPEWQESFFYAHYGMVVRRKN